ncbi:MAG: sigma factor-like helix-turn-helix DNA-binding protein, partial [Bryobacteraceae bacterium]
CQADALAELLRRQENERVRQAVLSLPAVYREALVLCDLEEMEYGDAARRMDCPVGTVRSRLHRARSLLAAKLGAGQITKGCAV